MDNIRKIRSWDDRIIDGIALAVSLLVLLVVLYPLLYVLSASFSDPNAITLGKVVLFPVSPTLEGDQRIFEYSKIWLGYRNSLFYTFFGTIINLLVTIPCAYALARPKLVGKGIFTVLFSITMFFSGGLIPSYLVVRSLGILNTPWALLLPGACSMWNVVIARTYFQSSIPYELQEAACIDGCSNTRTFFSIVLPLSKPILAVLALYYAVGHWNSYFNALIYLNNDQLYPLQIFLRNILILEDMTDMMGADSETIEMLMRRIELKEAMKFGIIVLSSLPMLILYPFLQKYFVKGVMIGAIKG